MSAASRRPAATVRAIAVVLVAGAVAAAAMTPSDGSRWAPPRVAAQPEPIPTPGPSTVPDLPDRLFGDPMDCDANVRIDPLPPGLAIGTRVTVAVTARVACADVFDGAAAVVLAGGATAASWPGVAAGIETLAEAIDGADVLVAVVDAAAPPAAPVRWAATPAERRAALAALTARPADAVVDGGPWVAALRTAGAALAALPPTRRPLLVVFDGRRPRSGSVFGQAELETVARALRDATGHTAIVDVSHDGWLAASARLVDDAGIVGLDASFDPSPATVAAATRLLAHRLRGDVDPVLLTLNWNAERLSVDLGTVAPAPDVAGEGFVQWLADGRPAPRSLRGRADLTARGIGRGALFAVVDAHRDGIEAGSGSDTIDLCVHPPGRGAAFCAPTPRPAPRPTATPHRTRSPEPTPTATVRPAAARVWLPVARR